MPVLKYMTVCLLFIDPFGLVAFSVDCVVSHDCERAFSLVISRPVSRTVVEDFEYVVLHELTLCS